MVERLYPSSSIYLAESRIKKAGRGVFAAANITSGHIIEMCPVLETPPGEDYQHMKATRLKDYYFMWKENQAVICLGYGSLYNHSYEPNATYKKDITNKIIAFIALKNIRQGEEITVNYNYGNQYDKSPLWIKDIPPEG